VGIETIYENSSEGAPWRTQLTDVVPVLENEQKERKKFEWTNN